MNTRDHFVPPANMIISTRRDPRFAALLDRVERGEGLPCAEDLPEGDYLSSNSLRRLEQAHYAYMHAYPVEGHRITRETVQDICKNSHDINRVVTPRDQWGQVAIKSSLSEDHYDLQQGRRRYRATDHQRGWRKKSKSLSFDRVTIEVEEYDLKMNIDFRRLYHEFINLIETG